MPTDDFRRIVVDDITPEALVNQLRINGFLLMISDEAGMLENFGGKVTVSKDDYDNLSALAKKEVVSERQTHKLKSERDTLLKEVAALEQKVSELTAELAEYKKPATISMKQLVQSGGSIDEAEQLRSMLKRALDIIEANGLQKEYEHFKQSTKNQYI